MTSTPPRCTLLKGRKRTPLHVKPQRASAAPMDMDWNLIVGFLLGIVASGIAAIVYERATSPLVEITLDDRPIALGQYPGLPPLAFYHVRIRNLPVRWPFASRKPAWSSKATIEVFNLNGTRTIAEAIHARWPSQPEPVTPTVAGDQSINLVDFARLMNARKVDIHSHEDEYIALAVKYEGQPECYIFSNESYLHGAWSNPAWRLNSGKYRVLITVFYERGHAQRAFSLANLRTARNSVEIDYASA